MPKCAAHAVRYVCECSILVGCYAVHIDNESTDNVHYIWVTVQYCRGDMYAATIYEWRGALQYTAWGGTSAGAAQAAIVSLVPSLPSQLTRSCIMGAGTCTLRWYLHTAHARRHPTSVRIPE